jgi:SPP1 gp7 family putative phage head morphogenesis protein
MPVKRYLSDVAIRQQVLLERLKAGEVRQVAGVFDSVDKAISNLIFTLRVEVSQLSKTALNQHLKTLSDENEKLLEKASEKFFTRMGKFADYQVGLDLKLMEIIAPSLRFKVPKAGVAYAEALARPMGAGGTLLKPFVDTWTASEVSRINNTIRMGWAEGRTNQQIMQTIRGTRANKYKDGILETSRRNAQAITRTGVQHVAASSRMSFFEQNSDVITGYRWVSTLDSKTTIVCRSLDGREFKMGGGPVPPKHINCRSAIVPTLDKKLGLDFLEEGATRSSAKGYVPAGTSYYEWLKDQPKEFQKQALGATRATLFQKGGLSAEEFAKLNLGRNFQPLTLEQMKTLNPAIFQKAGF